MATASWNGTMIAQADNAQVQLVDNNVYFPQACVNMDYLQASTHTSVCGWKGTASYYDVVVDGKVNFNAAWIYRDPLPDARNIAGHLAFWKGVNVER
ncbi:MAG: DUF427 domain-containing protein [Pseudomonadota bacterium]